MATGSGITLIETLEADIATPATNKQTLFVDSTLGTPSLALKDDTGTVTPVSGGGTVTHSAGALTASAVIVGNGGGDLKALASLGTTTQVLHGNAAGLPTYAAVALGADVSGDLPFANFVQATAASKLVGRGSASGAGDFEEVSLGSGLTMTGTTLSASGSGGTVTTTGSPASGNLTKFSGASAITNGDLSGDVTTSGTLVTTLAANQKIAGIVFVIDGSGAVITTGVKGFLQIPFGCTITAWTILSSDPAATSGSIVIDIWKDTLANYPPTVADTITASAKPTVTTATNATSSTLTGWTTTITAGDVLGFKVDSVTSILQATIQLAVTKT
jgi:hypothetical protein